MRISWIVVLGLTAACGSAATTPNAAPVAPSPVRDLQAIDAVYETFSRAYVELNAELVAGLYTEGALYLSPQGDIRRGRGAIGEGFARMFENARSRGERIAIRFDRIDRTISGDLAYEVGYFTLERSKAGEPINTSRGKFTVVLKRQPDGRWLFHVDAYNPVSSP